MSDSFSRKLERESQQRLDRDFLKSKPKGISAGEYLYRGSTAKWKRGRYRKQAEAQESKERKAYRKDNPPVRKGDAPIEGTKEEYIRRDQVADKLAATKKRIAGKTKSTRGTKNLASKKTARKRVAGK